MVMRAMIEQSRGLISAVDHTKFLRPARVHLGHLREVNVLVIDEALVHRLPRKPTPPAHALCWRNA